MSRFFILIAIIMGIFWTVTITQASTINDFEITLGGTGWPTGIWATDEWTNHDYLIAYETGESAFYVEKDVDTIKFVYQNPDSALSLPTDSIVTISLVDFTDDSIITGYSVQASENVRIVGFGDDWISVDFGGDAGLQWKTEDDSPTTEEEYFSITFTTGAPVPIPGAVWLLGSGLVGLVGIRRKFKKE